jgi:hypothetical protein
MGMDFPVTAHVDTADELQLTIDRSTGLRNCGRAIREQALTVTVRLLGVLDLSAKPAFGSPSESDDFWIGMGWHGFWYW